MLVCATVWVVSCSNDDNAVIEPADGPGVTYSKEHLSRKQIVPKIMEILQ